MAKACNFKISQSHKLPNASKMVLASSICCCTQVDTSHVTEHKYCNTNLVVSVFPAPDSPDITHDWNTH